MGLVILAGLDVIVDAHRDHPGLPRNIAADHQHHAEFTHGVCKPQHGRGHHAGHGQGQRHRQEAIQRTGPEARGHFQRLSANPRVTIARPEAAFYNFFSVDGVTDTMAFCKKLAHEYKVGLAPGEAFAAGGQGNIRLCFASGAERLSRGLDRIEAAIKAL